MQVLFWELQLNNSVLPLLNRVNSQECIAGNVIRVLEHSNIDIIVKNARLLVEREFTYEATLGRYRKIVEEL